ncbi:MAG: hypothetical protein CMC04_09280 [Flavobacteriaceae bacterium]|nr:hypothetical protein [Flavobacteriaceae bacterium]|tara:strand:- start:2814 stop:3263 length:450 start_codon:yes stop_codon:yes gene_type:complete
MKFQLLFSVFLIFLSCSKDGIINEIDINKESTEDIMQYSLFINPTNGGTIKISTQQGVINETDLVRVPTTQIQQTSSGGLLEGKLAGEFDRDTELTISLTAEEGFKFIGWTIDTCNKCYWFSRPIYFNEPLITLRINSDIFLTANFEKI